MKKYTVLKAFFKNSEQKNYIVGDIIELNDIDAENMLKYELIYWIDKPKKTKK